MLEKSCVMVILYLRAAQNGNIMYSRVSISDNLLWALRYPMDLPYNRLEKLGLIARQRYLCQRQKLQELIKHKLIS